MHAKLGCGCQRCSRRCTAAISRHQAQHNSTSSVTQNGKAEWRSGESRETSTQHAKVQSPISPQHGVQVCILSILTYSRILVCALDINYACILRCRIRESNMCVPNHKLEELMIIRKQTPKAYSKLTLENIVGVNKPKLIF